MVRKEKEWLSGAVRKCGERWIGIPVGSGARLHPNEFELRFTEFDS